MPTLLPLEAVIRLVARVCCIIAIVISSGSPLRGQVVSYSLNGTLGCGSFYPVGQWVPVRFTLTNKSDESGDGFIVVQTGRDNVVIVKQRVLVPAHSQLVTTGEICPGNPAKPSLGGIGEIANAEWTSLRGERLDLLPLGGERQSERHDSHSADLNAQVGGTVVVSWDPLNQMEGKQWDIDYISGTIELMHAQNACKFQIGDAQDLPRSALAYGPFGYIILGGPPDDLDISQRQALLDHLTGGATLIVADPDEKTGLGQSWLAPYMPVRVMGHRLMNAIVPAQADGGPIKLTGQFPITEAVAGEGDVQIVLSDKDYVHAAVRKVGLGRIIFTSFPFAALDHTDGRTPAVWRRLLGFEEPVVVIDPVKAAEQREGTMRFLLGRPAPGWGIAAIVTGAYVLGMLLAQLLLRGAQRPRAFAVVTILAAGICLALVGIAAVRDKGIPLSGGRVGTVLFGADGRGVQTEQFAFTGKKMALALEPARAGVSVTPLPTTQPASESNRANGAVAFLMMPNEIHFDPMVVPAADVREDSIGQIWQSQATVAPGVSFEASGQFDVSGLNVQVNSGIGVNGPLLLLNDATMRIPDLSAGQSSHRLTAGDLNPPGVYTHTTGLNGESDRLRALLIEQSLNFSQADMMSDYLESQAAVIGWLDDRAAPALMKPGNAPDVRVTSQMMLKAPLKIVPSPVGSTVMVDGSFNRFVRTPGMTPMPMQRGNKLVSSLPNSWVFNVVPPYEIGQLKVTKATVSVDLSAPQDVITLQTGQYVPSRVKGRVENPLGPVVVKWEGEVTHKSITFDVGPQDISPDGRLALRLEVKTLSAAAQAMPPQWSIDHLQVSLEGQVTGPPPQPPLVRETVEQLQPTEAPSPKAR